MKIFLKPILKIYLKYITKLVLLIHKPIIIVIGGSTNKHFVKKEIERVLKGKKLSVCATPKNFNTEIGLPLAILNLSSGYNSYRKWLPIIPQALKKIFTYKFPKYLVLELGTASPGDMKYLLTIIKPHIAIITNITQRYLESFENMNKLTEEYLILAKKLQKFNLLILNKDNIRIKSIGECSRAKTLYFSIKTKADIYAYNIQKNERGYKFTLNNKGGDSEHNLSKFGSHHIYAFLVGQLVKEYVSHNE